MAVTIKQLIDRNKQAFDQGFFIESLNLSFILVNKALKQIVKEELKQEVLDQKIKTSSLIGAIRKELSANVALKKKIPKKVLKDLQLFVKLHKEIQKELKFQFPEKKIAETSQLGINSIVILNTNLIKIKNNKVG